MIINVWITMILGVINLLFSWLPNIPEAPASFNTAVNNFFDLLFQNSGLVSFFLPMTITKIALPIAVVLINFKYIYKLFMWVIHKLPVAID